MTCVGKVCVLARVVLSVQESLSISAEMEVNAILYPLTCTQLGQHNHVEIYVEYITSESAYPAKRDTFHPTLESGHEAKSSIATAARISSRRTRRVPISLERLPAMAAAPSLQLSELAKDQARDELAGATRKTKKLVAGGLSGMLSALAFQPLDVLRTHQQGAFTATRPAVVSAGSAVAGQLRRGSEPNAATRVRAMWRGTSATLIRVSGGAALYFGSLDHLLALFPHTAVNTFLAGAFARTFAGSVMSPLTVVKARMEWQAPGAAHARLADVFRQVLRDEGPRGLYRGMVPTLVRDVPFSGLYVLIYTRLKEQLEAQCPQVPAYGLHFGSGVVAGVLATTVVHPADVVKTRMQLTILETGPRGEVTNVRNSLDLRQTVARIVQDEGWRGFAKGIMPRVVKRTLSTAVTWTIYEQLSLR